MRGDLHESKVLQQHSRLQELLILEWFLGTVTSKIQSLISRLGCHELVVKYNHDKDFEHNRNRIKNVSNSKVCLLVHLIHANIVRGTTFSIPKIGSPFDVVCGSLPLALINCTSINFMWLLRWPTYQGYKQSYRRKENCVFSFILLSLSDDCFKFLPCMKFSIEWRGKTPTMIFQVSHSQ